MRLQTYFSWAGMVGLTLLFSWACGGSGESDFEGSTRNLKIEMVYPDQGSGRQKFAVLDANTLFRIGTDLNDPGDPNHATHAVAEFYDGDELVAEGRAKLVRFSTDPGTLDTESREITVSSVPQNTLLDLNISLGRNINPNPDADIFEGFDSVFYLGSVNNLRILGDNVLIAGVEESVISVPLRTFNDGELFTIQFFGDFSSMPLVFDIGDLTDPVDDLGQEPIVSMSSLIDSTSPSPDATLPQIIGGNIFDYQSYFFEVPDVRIIEAPFDVIIESGNHLVGGNNYSNFLLSAIVTAEEIATGNALLVDFETTMTRMLTRIHESVDNLNLSAGNLTGVFNELEKVYGRIEPLFEASPSDLEVQVEDLALFELARLAARQSNLNQKLNFLDPTKLFNFTFQILGTSKGEALNELYFEKGGGPIRVLKTDGSLLMIIPHEIDGSTVAPNGNTIATGSVLASSNILRDLYQQNVGPYLETTAVWDYIYSITDLDSVGPIASDNLEVVE